MTNQENYQVPDEVEVYNNIEKSLEEYKDEDVYVIGGESVYEATMSRADKLLITHVDQKVEGCDAYYPNIREDKWQEVQREPHDGFTFVTYEKIG